MMHIKPATPVDKERADTNTKIPGKPKRWKQFVVTVAGVYPLTVMIPNLLIWLSRHLPPLKIFLLRGAISATLLVTCLMFVVLPLSNRLFRNWLAR
jgi:antibiotic biosynthesis monooxygenase (ABM) superfamily enzyme